MLFPLQNSCIETALNERVGKGTYHKKQKQKVLFMMNSGLILKLVKRREASHGVWDGEVKCTEDILNSNVQRVQSVHNISCGENHKHRTRENHTIPLDMHCVRENGIQLDCPFGSTFKLRSYFLEYFKHGSLEGETCVYRLFKHKLFWCTSTLHCGCTRILEKPLHLSVPNILMEMGSDV